MTDADITDLLHRVRAAAPQQRDEAEQELLEAVYQELRRMAQMRTVREPNDLTLSPTALVHEVYLRLFAKASAPGFDNRGHFFAAAGEAMRRILVERARRYASRKRGAGSRRAELPTDVADVDLWTRAEDVLAIDRALEHLEGDNPRFAQVAKLRFFVGLTAQETAETLELSLRTVERSWTGARAFLLSHLSQDSERAGASSSPP